MSRVVSFLYTPLTFLRASSGDLATMMENIGCMSEEHGRFYIAEMAVGVTVLHDLGFIHRDLKPANFLVDAGGHLKLTDFGLSKKAVAGFVLQGSCEVERGARSGLTLNLNPTPIGARWTPPDWIGPVRSQPRWST